MIWEVAGVSIFMTFKRRNWRLILNRAITNLVGRARTANPKLFLLITLFLADWQGEVFIILS